MISLKPGGGLAEWYGTSMAAPHVAAILLLLQNTTLNPNTDGVAIGDPDSRPDPLERLRESTGPGADYPYPLKTRHISSS